MIPKIIHYCWLSNDPIPAKLQKCMQSWKEKLTGYEFILWNYDRFDVNSSSSIWVKEAFAQKKYVQQADYIRLFAVYHYGGIYLDMDVEVVKPFSENVLQKLIMLAYEDDGIKNIEAGCFGAEKEHPYIKKCLESFENRHFILSEVMDLTYSLPKVMSSQLKDFELLDIHSSDYFTAKSLKTGLITITDNTYCIHHFEASWEKPLKRIYVKIKNKSIKLFGYRLGKLFVLPLYVITILISDGFSGLRRSFNRHFRSQG
jgi:mannosyltransferase OCH1-like enzyme